MMYANANDNGLSFSRLTLSVVSYNLIVTILAPDCVIGG